MTFLYVIQNQLQMSNSTQSQKTESNDYKNYIILLQVPNGSLTIYKSQISRILAYKWVIRLSPSASSQKTDSNDYKYPINTKIGFKRLWAEL